MFGKYIHVKAIDGAGNVSEPSVTKIETIILTSQVNLELEGGKGGVILDWSNYDKTNRYFVIYRKRENGTEWETIVSLEDKLNSNTYIDNTANDTTSPTVPSLEIEKNIETNELKINTNSTDPGNKYTYYIESYDSETGILKSRSNVAQ